MLDVLGIKYAEEAEKVGLEYRFERDHCQFPCFRHMLNLVGQGIRYRDMIPVVTGSALCIAACFDPFEEYLQELCEIIVKFRSSNLHLSYLRATCKDLSVEYQVPSWMFGHGGIRHTMQWKQPSELLAGKSTSIVIACKLTQFYCSNKAIDQRCSEDAEIPGPLSDVKWKQLAAVSLRPVSTGRLTDD